MMRQALGARMSGWLAGMALSGAALAQDPPAPTSPPAPPSNVQAADHDWDNGTHADLTWTLSPDDGSLTHYEIRKAVGLIDGVPVEPDFSLVEVVKPSVDHYKVSDLRYEIDRHDLRKQYREKLDVEGMIRADAGPYPVGYLFQVVAVRDGARSEPAQTAASVQPTMQWFDGDRLWIGIITIVICGSVVTFIGLARAGYPMRVRKIAGLEAVDEAVGRATEMGRPVLFVAGTQDMNDIQTVAGITVLARVARTAAEYDAKVEMPTSRSLVMTTGRETVQAAFLAAGRPDAYNEDLIYYVTDEQFGFVAYLQGMMVREKPAACFYMGHFFAESLILAETGNSIGAIQIAGTAAPAQLPFFVAACDYTLIGEEFFAASAYLSGEPEQLGSLKGQDVGKLLVAAFLLIGCVLATGAAMADPDTPLREGLEGAVKFIRETMLT